MKHHTELLLPAGSLEKLKIAILYGADAVYMGTPDMSLRTRSSMSLEDVISGIAYAHDHGKRAYLTLNLFTHNKDIDKLPAYLETIKQAQPDGVIVADPGVFDYLRSQAPEIELHISTQANICSHLSVKFWEDLGAKLVVLGREVSFPELAEIREKCPDIKLEAFVHGAMCMTYSGRCLLSNFLAERGANQGNCANSCRWNYKLHVALKDGSKKELELNDETRDMFEFFLEEKERPGELLPFEEDERGSYILNGKDLCLMPKLKELLDIGIDSLKIEGRNRSAYYVAVTAHAYRMAMNAWRKNPVDWDPMPFMQELMTIPNRGYTLAFHDGTLTHHAHNYEDTDTLSPWEFAGIVHRIDEEAIYVNVKNKIIAGEVLEFIPHTNRPPMRLRIYEFEDVHNKNARTEEINAGQNPLIKIPLDWFHQEDKEAILQEFPVFTIVRKKRILTDSQAARIKLDLVAAAVEQGKAKEEAYIKARDAYLKTLDEDEEKTPPKSPALGKDGCCGRGCNGCLHFWNDPAYEKSREKLRAKKPGELLSKEEAKESKVATEAPAS